MGCEAQIAAAGHDRKARSAVGSVARRCAAGVRERLHVSAVLSAGLRFVRGQSRRYAVIA